jgi:uncharacterized protein YeaO (DUF488 family)
VTAEEQRLKTKRWNDAAERSDGQRLLVCRYRPRGVRKDEETWDAWVPALAPSCELHADYYGKHGAPIPWSEFRRRYLAEMKAQRDEVAALGARVAAGETITLLCSSACADPSLCHRTLLRDLLLSAAASPRLGRTAHGAPGASRAGRH